ncbi:MAG: hypothetical protein ACRD5G_11265 [Candidatus Acidiferrales bacterium]
MAEFMPHNAPLVVLTFLFTGLLLGAAGLVVLWALAAQRYALAVRVLVAGTVAAGVYAGTLLARSLGSEEKTLAAGQHKYFCEIDCHAAYTVTDVRTAKTLGEDAEQATADGTFYVVTLRTWFDGETVSSRRPEGMPLWPNPRLVRVVDEAGRRYSTSLAGQKAIVARNVPLTHALRPGESYETVLVFDLPADAASPRLLVADRFPLSQFLIGHENSPLHRKIYFALDAASTASR